MQGVDPVDCHNILMFSCLELDYPVKLKIERKKEMQKCITFAHDQIFII